MNYLLIAAFLLVWQPAQAYTPTAEQIIACKADWWKFCAPDLSAKGIEKCFRKHQHELSAECLRAKKGH